MIDERWIIVGAIINFSGSLIYAYNVIKGRVKPNRVTWFFWALAPLIAFFAELEEGVGLASLMTFVVGFGPLCSFIASFFNQHSYWKLTSFDYACGLFALLGLVLWYLTKTGNVAILFSILADTAAAIPTIRKAWKYPETENPWVFLFAFTNALITLMALQIWNFAHYAFPVYIAAQCIFLFTIIRFRPLSSLKYNHSIKIS